MHPLVKFGLTILLLASLVFVHELGHFLIAKLFRVKVLRFSLGFGPRILGFTWGETEYVLALLPLGGYVKMAGDDPTEEVTGADRGRGFLEQPPWKRGLIALAGPGMSLLFPVLVYFAAFYWKPEEISSRLGWVEPERPAYAAGLRAGDRIVSVDGHPVRYFNELRELVSPFWQRELLIAYERGGKVDTVKVTPERVEEKTPLETEIRGVIGVAPFAAGPVVGLSDPAAPAAMAGLRTFDRVVKVGDTKVATYSQLERASVAATGPLKLTVVRDLPKNGAAGALTTYQTLQIELAKDERTDCGRLYCGFEPAELFAFSVLPGSPAHEAGLRRGDRLVELNGKTLVGWSSFERLRLDAAEKPLKLAFLHDGVRIEEEITQRKVEPVDDDYGATALVFTFGAQPDTRASSFVAGEKIPLEITALEALTRALKEVPKSARKIALGLAGMFSGEISVKSVGGPLMIYDIAGRSAEAGREYYLEVMALISINLGVMNLIPIPILDGFQILSAVWEAVRRRPISLKARITANYIGLVMLIGLMALAMKNDITRLFFN